MLRLVEADLDIGTELHNVLHHGAVERLFEEHLHRSLCGIPMRVINLI